MMASVRFEEGVFDPVHVIVFHRGTHRCIQTMYFGPEPAAGFGKNSHEILEYKFLALISTVDGHNRAFVYST